MNYYIYFFLIYKFTIKKNIIKLKRGEIYYETKPKSYKKINKENKKTMSYKILNIYNKK
jgi:hypothetical protein